MNRLKSVLSSILILLGILLVISPVLNEVAVKYYSSLVSESDIPDEIVDDNEDEYDYDSVGDVDIETVIRGVMSFDRSKLMGMVYVPDLNMKVPIMKGLSDASLVSGAGTMKPGQVMGSGNYALAGHNMRDKSLLFGSLMDIEEGTHVYLSDGKDIYEYKVVENRVVPDDRVDMVDDSLSEEFGGPIVSLMTCYGTSKSGKRFFSIGEYIGKFPASDAGNVGISVGD